jgi:hypothetical protein
MPSVSELARLDQEAELPTYDYLAGIIAYESGELDEEGVITLFQYLVDTNIIRGLQGSYQRQAYRMMEAGLMQPKA